MKLILQPASNNDQFMLPAMVNRFTTPVLKGLRVLGN